jgi:hemolysin D
VSALANAFPTLARHASVFREAWRQQNDADGKQRAIAEHEFLPAALEIIETPPSPGLRWLMLTLCSLFAIALIWSFIGRVDVVAVASGKTLPAASVKLIQPIEIGSVRAIHVRDGQRVRKGQLLVELDPTVAGAEAAQANRGLQSARIAEARNKAIIAYLAGRPASFQAPPGTPPLIAQTQGQIIHSAIAEYEGERAALLEGRAERAAELAAAEAETAKLRETLPLVEQQLAARRELTLRGNFPKLRLLEYEQGLMEHKRSIEVQQAAAAKARAGMANIAGQLARLRGTFAKTAVTELATAGDESSVRAEELTKTERRRLFQQIRSPVDGVVQQLAIHTVGGIVQPAQPLMVIVPEGTEVEVEARILNRDIGFVREGQPVRVKFDAFPFTDYGLVDGVVETISRDAVPEDAEPKDQRPGGSQPPLVYMARVRLSRNYIQLRDRRQLIGPGLAVQAEIKTGERRIIQYLLSPISQALDEAGRER